MYRRGDKWYCTLTVEYDANPGDETAIGVDIVHNYLLAANVGSGESMLVSGREGIWRRYCSPRASLQQVSAPRARNRAGDEEE